MTQKVYKLINGDLVPANGGWTKIVHNGVELLTNLDTLSDGALADYGIQVIQTSNEFQMVSSEGEVIDMNLSVVKSALKARVATERWSLEQGTVEWNGNQAQCDRESRANYVGMVVATQAGLRTDNGIYKFVDGPFPVKNSDVLGLATAVATRVQSLYDQEAAIIAQIDALPDVAAAQAFTWKFD